MLRSVLNRLSKRNTTLKLGRWDTVNKSASNDEIKAIWNSADHCGDQICGDPKLVKELVLSSNTIETDDFCCLLLGMNTCKNCNLLKKGLN